MKQRASSTRCWRKGRFMFGETLVIPDLSYKQRKWKLTNDEQTRCLSYIARHLSDYCTLPQGLIACVTSVPSITKTLRSDAAKGYPGICLYVRGDGHVNDNDIPNPLELENRIDTWIQETGKEKLLQLSVEETLTWQNVIDFDNNILLRNRLITRNNKSSSNESFEEWAQRLEVEERNEITHD